MAGAEEKVYRGPAGGGKNCQGKDKSNPVIPLACLIFFKSSPSSSDKRFLLFNSFCLSQNKIQECSPLQKLCFKFKDANKKYGLFFRVFLLFTY